MIPIHSLNFGFKDAENYKRKENKELFNNIFVRTTHLDKLLDRGTFFLIGEKGTGKTAYAVYLENNSYKETVAQLRYIRETDYQKFIQLKQQKHLVLSDYTNIWKVIIYLLIAEKIRQDEVKNPILARFGKFHNLIKAIDEYYANAFSPEIIHAISFVEKSKEAAELISKHFKLGGEDSTSMSFSESRFQTNLMYIQRKFEDSLGALKLSKNYTLMIDGIDIRPGSVEYKDYLECVKGLANAIWDINNDFFSGIKDSKGRLKVVLLIRPDIFDSLGLQNQNNKIRDNAVLLDWRTNYADYANSAIFSVADNLLCSQQKKELKTGEAWNYYFPYEIKKDSGKSDASFVSFLRFSFHRPRDIVTMLSLLHENCCHKGSGNSVFSAEDFNDLNFRGRYADYLLGEIKDHLAFYYLGGDYELFLKFFEYLKGKPRFSYSEYIEAFYEFTSFLKANKIKRPKFFETPDIFLQFLYELNVICYVEKAEDRSFIRWCFRERSVSNISPKIKTNEVYEIHYGLAKALNAGKEIIKRKKFD